MSSKVHFCSTESQTFYWSILIADDSVECRCVNSGITGQVSSFQNPGVCLQAFPSFLPHLLPALLLGHFLCGIWLSFLTLYSYSILSITPYFCLPCLTVRIECSFLHLHVLPAVDSREPLGICTITFTHHPDSRTIVFVKKGYHSPSP